jgi:tetratricopeptide (TPR) repeat protein
MTNHHTINISQTIQTALKHHQAGQLAQAEALYRQVLQIAPNNPDALHLSGLIAHQTGKNHIAVELISEAIRANPSSPMYYNLGNVFKAQGNLNAAVESYQKAISLKPDYAEAYNNLGNTLKNQGRFDAAADSYHRALSLKPDNAEAHNNLGTVLNKQGHLDAAIENFQTAISLRPDYTEAYNNLGNAFKIQGRFDAAVDCYHRALSLKPDNAEAHNNLGNALKMQGYLDEATGSFRKAISLKPDYADAFFNLHSLLTNTEDMAPSIECMKKAVAINPANTNFRFFLGMLLDYSGASEAAAEHFAMVENSQALHRARLDAWQYIKTAGKGAPQITGSNIQTFKLGMDAAIKEGLVLEFGVRFGASIRQIAALVEQEVHGFDSFEGLPEAWHHEPKGIYTTKGVIPNVPENVSLHVGWFEDTLPEFLIAHDGPVRFMNIDCDIYSSTKTVLQHLAQRIVPGTVIVFDEYIGNEHWREDEFKAFQEAVVQNGWAYEYLCFSFTTKQVAVRIS